MNIEEIKRNIRKGITPSENISKSSSISTSSLKNKDIVNLKFSPEKEEDPPSPQSEIWDYYEEFPKSFYIKDEVLPTETKPKARGRPSLSKNTQSSNIPPNISLEDFISKTEIKKEKYDWRKDTKKGRESRLNFSEYLKNFFTLI